MGGPLFNEWVCFEWGGLFWKRTSILAYSRIVCNFFVFLWTSDWCRPSRARTLFRIKDVYVNLKYLHLIVGMGGENPKNKTKSASHWTDSCVWVDDGDDWWRAGRGAGVFTTTYWFANCEFLAVTVSFLVISIVRFNTPKLEEVCPPVDDWSHYEYTYVAWDIDRIG